MRAIDRATRWAQLLEDAGFEITSETMGIHTKYLSVYAKKNRTYIWYSIDMSSPRTSFRIGGTNYKSTRKPSEMAQMVFSELETQRYMRKMEGAA